MAPSTSGTPSTNLEGLRREVQEHGRLRLALCPRMGLPWAADRDQSRQAARPKEAPDGSHRGSPGVPGSTLRSIWTFSAQQFKRIGVFGRWDNPYSTMTPEYEAIVLRTFYSFLEQGFVYKGLRSVYWCIHDKTALAEAEVEYENHTSPSVWVKYAMTSDPRAIDRVAARKESLHHHLDHHALDVARFDGSRLSSRRRYVALESDSEVYIVAAKLAAEVIAKCSLADAKEIARFRRTQSGESHLSAILSWIATILGVLADYVTMDRHRARCTPHLAWRRRLYHRREIRAGPDLRSGRSGHPAQRPARIRRQDRSSRRTPPIVELLKTRGVLLHTERSSTRTRIAGVVTTRSSSARPSSGSSPWRRPCLPGGPRLRSARSRRSRR